MYKIPYEEKYNAHVILYKLHICRTERKDDNVYISCDIPIENVNKELVNQIIDTLNTNWSKVKYVEYDNYTDVIINNELYFRSYDDTKELLMNPNRNKDFEYSLATSFAKI
jgi:hypothetical protein